MNLKEINMQKEKPIFVMDYSSIVDIFNDKTDTEKFLKALEDAKKVGGIFLTTPTQLLKALESARYLDFHAGNMQRLLKVIDVNIVVPKSYAGHIIKINRLDDKKLLANDVILFAKATNGELP